MSPRRFGFIVGIRELREEKARNNTVIVKLGKPRKMKGGDWECPFLIKGLGNNKIDYGHGIDAIQALLQAIEGIRVKLEQSGKRFTWAGGELAGTGFTRFVPLFYGLDFSMRLEKLIEREVNRFARTAKRGK